MGKIFQTVNQLMRQNNKSLTISFFVLSAIFLALGWLANSANANYEVQSTPQAASDLFLSVLALSLLKILAIALVSQFLYAKFFSKTALPSKDKIRANAKIFSFLAVGALAVIGFIIVVVTPIMHLARIFRLDDPAFWSLVFWLSLPIVIVAGHFATRLLLVLPNWAQGKKRTLRQAFAVTEYQGGMVMRLNLMLILILISVWLLNIMAQSKAVLIAFAFILSLAIIFTILLISAVYQRLDLENPTN